MTMKPKRSGETGGSSKAEKRQKSRKGKVGQDDTKILSFFANIIRSACNNTTYFEHLCVL